MDTTGRCTAARRFTLRLTISIRAVSLIISLNGGSAMSAQSKSASVVALDEAATDFSPQQIDDLRIRLAGQVLPQQLGVRNILGCLRCVHQ